MARQHNLVMMLAAGRKRDARAMTTSSVQEGIGMLFDRVGAHRVVLAWNIRCPRGRFRLGDGNEPCGRRLPDRRTERGGGCSGGQDDGTTQDSDDTV